MIDPRTISIEGYSYELPAEKIAFYPLPERDASKLLIYQNGTIAEDVYKNISGHLPENSLLVFNDTKVVEARILFQKQTGGIIEIFCLYPNTQYKNIQDALSQTQLVRWHCLVGGASKWKPGQVLEKSVQTVNGMLTFSASYVQKYTDSFIIEFKWDSASLSFAEILQLIGAIPLPPYIKRPPDKKDTERYQTVYAKHAGSVAAPTAGLHFTDKIVNDLSQKNVQSLPVTLHVGAGTFKPVKAITMQDHEMHAEWIDVGIDVIKQIADNPGRKIVAVGTTSLRTIESLYWLGVKAISNKQLAIGNKEFTLSQWEAYDLENKSISVKDALHALIVQMEENKVERLLAQTQILIAPGYSFKIINGLITNFHQPKSTLLLLVAAFIGDDWKRVYEYALTNDFRFLSYGDGCLLWKA